MLSERTIINGLLLLGGMILGPYLIIFTLETNQIALLSFCGLVFLFSVFFFVKDRIAIYPVIGGYFGGSLNFLPLGFTLVEVFSLVAILYYAITYIVLNRRPISLGPRNFLLPILVLAAIVLYHDHKVGLRVLGGASEGSRPGLLILVAIVAYFCGINIPSPSTTFLRRVPFYCFIVTLISSAPFLLTTYYPGLAPYVYYISGNVNLDAYASSIQGADLADFSRNGALAGIGASLTTVLVCYFPISTWWHPKRWIFILLTAVSFVFVLFSGYRNTLFGFMMVVILSSICYSRLRVFVLLPILALLPLAVIIIQNDHPYGVEVPLNVQRSMSFLPGNWDDNVIESKASSNGFREEINRVYESEYLAKSPWIGNGFTFDPNEPEGLTNMANIPGTSDKGYYMTKAFIVSKNFHTGWISLYDAVGIVGGIAFIWLYVGLVWNGGRLVFEASEDTRSQVFPLKVFIFTNLLIGLIGYFTTFGSFGQSLVSICGFATVLVHLTRIETQNTTFVVTPSTQLSAPRDALSMTSST